MNKIKFTTKSLLKNNFFIGLGNVLNLSGSYFNYNNYLKSENISDFNSINSDWQAIGNDIKESKIKFHKNNKLDFNF
jgi:hypothetical protein